MDPTAITQQKDDHLLKLNEQVIRGVASLNAQVQHQKDLLHTQVQERIRHFVAQVDAETHHQMMVIDHEMLKGVESLRQQHAQRSSEITQGAVELMAQHKEKMLKELTEKSNQEWQARADEVAKKMEAEKLKWDTAFGSD